MKTSHFEGRIASSAADEYAFLASFHGYRPAGYGGQFLSLHIPTGNGKTNGPLTR